MRTEHEMAMRGGDRPIRRAACPPHSQDYWPRRPLFFVADFQYQPRVAEQFRESWSLRFFRPLLYRLSYLGGTLILPGS